jgi:hypothetical protein
MPTEAVQQLEHGKVPKYGENNDLEEFSEIRRPFFC